MRVAALFARSDVIGGTSVHVRDLSVALARLGISSTVLVGGRGPFVADLADHGVPCRVIPHLGRAITPAADVRATAAVTAALRDLQPDVVVGHGAKAGVVGRLAARRLGLPAVYNAHGWSFAPGVPSRHARLHLVLERAAGRLPGSIIDVCDHDRELALSRGVGRPDQHVVIHNGIPDAPTGSRADPWRDPPHLVMVARFEPQKDHATFLHALAGLLHRRWTAEIIGDGPGRDDAIALAAALGVGGRVRFPGARRDVAARLAGAQIFVLTSHWEGLPLTILEAMRAGLPVIASDVGGVREALEDGLSGLLVPRQDPTVLRRAIELLVDDPATRVAIGRRARRFYEARFVEDRMLERTATLYDTVAGGRSIDAMAVA